MQREISMARLTLAAQVAAEKSTNSLRRKMALGLSIFYILSAHLIRAQMAKIPLAHWPLTPLAICTGPQYREATTSMASFLNCPRHRFREEHGRNPWFMTFVATYRIRPVWTASILVAGLRSTVRAI